MGETLDYLATFARFPMSLRRFLRHTLTLEEAESIVRERLAHRDDNFLAQAEHAIYGRPASPYLALLRLAGCELGDLRALVRQHGLEGALRSLREAGVYVTFEEFKGRKPIVRPGLTLPVTARDFDNPRGKPDFASGTGGSSGLATYVGQNLDHVAATAPYQLLAQATHGLVGVPSAVWRGTMPDSNLRPILHGAYIGNVPERWFSPRGWRDSQHWLKYGLATYYLIFWIRLCGVRMPMPEPVRLDQAVIVARWAAATLKSHGRCHIAANVSRGVRICVAAHEAGIDLTGTSIVGAGEPATPAKVQRMRNAGARYVSNYVMAETGRIGSGCANPIDGSDVHFFSDAFALFTYPYQVEGFDLSVPAFNVTTLLPTAPKIMLNAQMDDYGVVEVRKCGCLLESYGFTTHLREIHSYSKLTGEGVSLIGSEMLQVLEETLPARFGGSPLDYQLLEQEDDQGFTRLFLLISPSVVIDDEQAVVDTLLAGLRRSSPAADAARSVWQNAGTIQIKRTEPVLTRRGKLTPLRVERRPGAQA